MLQPKLLKKVLEVLSQNHIDYMVTGSLVSSMYGEPRATHDIDIVVNFSYKDIPVLTNAFTAPDYYLSASAMQEAIERGSMFNLLDTTEGDKAGKGAKLIRRWLSMVREPRRKKVKSQKAKAKSQ